MGSISLCKFQLGHTTTNSHTHNSAHLHRLKLRVNCILLTTATGGRYMLEAATLDDRDTWLAEIKIASKLITHSH